LDIVLDKQTATEASIKISINEADYQPKVEEKVKEYGKKANIKGFRPGKVPPTLIKKMYGKAILVDEINNLVSQSVNNYIKEQNLKILGEPLPNVDKAKDIDWDAQKDFEFEYNVGLVDDFNVDIAGTDVISYELLVNDEVINDTIDNIKNQFAKNTDKESSEEGDSIYGEVTSDNSDLKRFVIIPTEKITPSEKKKFLGVKKDDIVEFDPKSTFDSDEVIEDVFGGAKEEILNAGGNLKLQVKSISHKEPAELDQELFDKVFGKDAVSNEEEFRGKVKETIAENYKRETDLYLERQIQNKIVENTNLGLPDGFLKRWLHVSNEGKISETDIEKEYDLYAKDLKWTLIKNKIAEESSIKTEHSDVIERTKDLIRQQFASSGMGDAMEDQLDSFADNYLKGNKGENYFNLYNRLHTEKVIQYIKEKINLKHEKVSVEEFKKIISN
jgi:trigger factor